VLESDPARKVVEDAVHAAGVEAGPGRNFRNRHAAHAEQEDFPVRRRAQCQHPLGEFAGLHELTGTGMSRLRFISLRDIAEWALTRKRRAVPADRVNESVSG
jgi:hypothetical protein